MTGSPLPDQIFPMKTTLVQPRTFEFAFPHLATHVRVEDYGHSVEILATRDTFSIPRKIAFIRALAAEGFIYDSFQRFPSGGATAGPAVHWLVDFSWRESPATPTGRARLRKKMLLLLGLFLLWATLLADLCLGVFR